ncbi:hypothetical protein ACIQCN_06080 [Pseudarthrobacter sp. NPDC092424]|uniref:hypothetical protein n=1 Tax=Pseudarthrobacter sp. NPDC092424 TaxID=3364415 RepID=UPI0038076523
MMRVDSGDDSLRIHGPAVDGSLVIRGGTGGISVQSAELTGGAEKLDALADELQAVQAETGRILQELCRLERLPPWSTAPAADAVRAGHGIVGRVAADMEGTGARIRDCIRDYQLAEAGAVARRTLGFLTWGEVSQRVTNFLATWVPDRDTLDQTMAVGVVGAGAVLASSLTQAVEGVPPDFLSRPLDARRAETLQVQLDASPAGLLERIRAIEARGAGYIEVIEVGDAGRKAYVVVVPGTQSVAVGQDNPFDLGGIHESMAWDSGHVTAAILQALKAAGAHEGDPVVAVGYSQGGIHAMNFAADPQVLEKFDVRYVLTAGSPVGRIEPGRGVELLHLEHQADGVPGGDGTPNPDTGHRVTVTLTNDVSGYERGALGPGHALANYEDGARAVSASTDPALAASSAVLTGVLGAGGTATATRFSLTRAEPQSGSPFRPFSPRVHRSDVSYGPDVSAGRHRQAGRSPGR